MACTLSSSSLLWWIQSIYVVRARIVSTQISPRVETPTDGPRDATVSRTLDGLFTLGSECLVPRAEKHIGSRQLGSPHQSTWYGKIQITSAIQPTQSQKSPNETCMKSSAQTKKSNHKNRNETNIGRHRPANQWPDAQRQS